MSEAKKLLPDVRYAFKVQGSEKNPYDVIFELNAGTLHITCTCKAGKNYMHCKHRIRILKGLIENVVSPNLNEIQIIHGMVQGTVIHNTILEIESSEEKLNKLTDTIRGLKYKLIRLMEND